jgi:hypothetical protein
MATVPYDSIDDEVRAHEATFHQFVQLVYVGVLHIATTLVALAIGGIEGHWAAAAGVIVLATFLAAYSLANDSKPPMALVLLLAVSVLGLL